MGGLGRLATWHFPSGPVGTPARWAATSNVESGQVRSIVDPLIPKFKTKVLSELPDDCPDT